MRERENILSCKDSAVAIRCLAVRGAFRMENKNRAKQTNKQNRFRYECETEKQTGISHMTG